MMLHSRVGQYLNKSPDQVPAIQLLTMSIDQFVCKEGVFENYFSLKTSTHANITDFSNYVIVLQFLHAILQ